MSDIIRLLPDNIANQTPPATSFNDRPAWSGVAENAIDAGADRVQVIIKDAGRTLIQVIDNGRHGVTDARTCFENTLPVRSAMPTISFIHPHHGFRGEALASIAAIAQVEMKTRLHDEDLGTCIIMKGSRSRARTLSDCRRHQHRRAQSLLQCTRPSQFPKSNTVETPPYRR